MEGNAVKVVTGGRVKKGKRDKVEKAVEGEGDRDVRKTFRAEISGVGCWWKKREMVDELVEGDIGGKK